MFLPDTPINNIENDQLGRSEFARKLGETLRDWDRTESIVIGLYGPWGNGKTSLLNMAVEHIEKTTKDWEKKKQPIIIRFNPWNFTDSQQLLSTFFSEIAIEISSREPNIGSQLKEQVNRFAKVLSHLENLPLVGDAVSSAAKVAAQVTSDESLQTTKDKTAEKFEALDRRILIVLDDIDRLSEAEIRLVFRLIKLNADFPNTIYLLAFARNVVEQALSTEHGVSGRDYLEKIVQVGFDVPVVDSAHLSQVLFDELNQIIAVSSDGYWDSNRWWNLYHAGLKSLFTSLRNIKRYINGLAFNLKIVSAQEINLVDFVALEALRMFMPEVYKAIAENKSLFTATSGWNVQRDTTVLQQQFERIFQLSANPHITRNICQQLFPQTQRAYANTWYGAEEHATWRKERRLCSTDVFDVYFLLGIPKGEVAKSELAQIAATATNVTRLLTAFRAMREDGRIARLLDQLPDVLDDLNETGIIGLCQALLVLGDELPDEHRGLFDLGTDLQILFILRLALAKLDEAKRCAWLQTAIRARVALFMPVYIVSHAEPNSEETKADPLFSAGCLADLQVLCVNAIQSSADDGGLRNSKGLSYVLFRWRKWSADPKPIQDFVDQQLSSPDGLLSFLSGFMYAERSQTTGEATMRTSWKLNQEAIDDIIPREKLRSALEALLPQIDPESLSERQLLAVQAIRNTLTKAEDGVQQNE